MSEKAIKKLVEGEDVLLSEETTVYLVDNSGSMEKTLGFDDAKQVISKYRAVQMAMKAMLEARLTYETADKLGIITFSGNFYSEHLCKVLMEPAVVQAKHLPLVEQIGAGGGTPMYQAFEKAARVLADAQGLVRIVLMSDGEPNEGFTKGDIRGLVQKLAKDYGFVIDCVGIGIPGQTAEYDEDFMKALAADGAGEFYPIDNVQELTKRLVQFSKERAMLLGKGVKLLGTASATF